MQRRPRPYVLINHTLWIDFFFNPSRIIVGSPTIPGLYKPLKLDELKHVVSLLRLCAKNKDLHTGIRIHVHIQNRGGENFLHKCSNALITMYARCGAVVEAMELLHKYRSSDVFAWTAAIAGYAQNGQCQDAAALFEKMLHAGLAPAAMTYTCILKVCGSMGATDKGKQIHDEIAKQGLLESNMVVGNALVTMYVRCSDLNLARQVFEELPYRNVVSWNALIAGYIQHGKHAQALDCFEKMQAENIYPDAVTFTSILTACASMKRVYLGEQIHDEILKQGLLSKDIALGNALVSMYAKCSALGKARRVLEEMLVRDVISWSTLIGGYAQNGEDKQALDCYDEMQSDGIPPNTVTFLSIIEACGNLGLTFKGEQVHEEVKRLRLLDNNIVLGTALLDMYMKCGSFRKAWQVLEGLPTQTVVSWSAIISGYVNKGEYRKAIACFEKMQTEGVPPNQVTFASILKACGCLGDADTGRRIHHEVAQHGLLRDDVVLATALVDMYVQCGALGAAQQALSELPFRNVIMWNSLIAGYVARGQNRKAVACYEEMNNEGLSPNAATFACMLKACGSSRVIKKGTLIHRDIMQQSLLQKNTVLGNALVHMYVSCSALTKAHQVLEELPIRNCISWSTLIAGYAQHCEVERVFICFEQMLQEGCSPDVVTFTCILKACTMLGAVEIGEKIHLEVARQGLLENVSLGTALVDMYAKCGDIVKAHQVLNETSIKDVGCWNALIGGYIQEGKFQQAFSLFDFMLLEKLTPNAITFLGMLRACSLLGLLDDAKVFVDIMSMRYGINLEFKHGSSIADLCCHLGYLDKALKAI